MWCTLMFVLCCCTDWKLTIRIKKAALSGLNLWHSTWINERCTAYYLYTPDYLCHWLTLEPSLSLRSSCAWRTSGPSWQRAVRYWAWRKASCLRPLTCLTSGTLERWGDVCSVTQNETEATAACTRPSLADLNLSNLLFCPLSSLSWS